MDGPKRTNLRELNDIPKVYLEDDEKSDSMLLA